MELNFRKFCPTRPEGAKSFWTFSPYVHKSLAKLVFTFSSMNLRIQSCSLEVGEW